MILLKSVVQVYVHPMPNRFTQFAPDRRRIGVVTVGRDPVRDNPGHGSGGTEERFGGGQIAALAEHHVPQSAVAVDGPVQIPPEAVDFDKPLVHVTSFGRCGGVDGDGVPQPEPGEFRLPIPHRLMAEHDAADQKHLGEIAQAELVAQAPEHHERDDVARILRPVQQAGAALVELLAALAAAESAISLSRALRPLRHSRRTAAQAPHPRPPPPEGA